MAGYNERVEFMGASKKDERKKMPESGMSEKPFGREDVMAAVIDSAADLFSCRGFDGVSIREIAKRAGVNHGLIHRHFGSKENLRRITLQHMADAMLADVKGATTFDEITNRAFRSLEKHERFWRILARTLLDGRGVGDIHGRYPMAEYLTGRVKTGIEEGILKKNLDPRVAVAIMFSFSCGFSLFEPFVLAASGLDRLDPAEARKSVFKEAISLILSI